MCRVQWKHHTEEEATWEREEELRATYPGRPASPAPAPPLPAWAGPAIPAPHLLPPGPRPDQSPRAPFPPGLPPGPLGRALSAPSARAHVPLTARSHASVPSPSSRRRSRARAFPLLALADAPGMETPSPNLAHAFLNRSPLQIPQLPPRFPLLPPSPHCAGSGFQSRRAESPRPCLSPSPKAL
ncbi:hypothetical protein U9M48_001159 [Paspalum notatum var. saurae]|uniref:Chromo domain-containing protein n=1 Tax=Paspalum notatum var. saurae TaxID=547442 RepID=A0AAQ3SIP8_PASNO